MSDSGSAEDEDSQQENYPLPNVHNQSTFKFINGKEGMATCERCGSVGIKHAFYSKSKRFCSLSCSRSFATSQREGKPLPPITEVKASKKQMGGKRQSVGKIRLSSQGHLPRSIGNNDGTHKSFDWGPYLVGCKAEAAPVTCFRHVPMHDNWENITVGMKVELPNYDFDLPTNMVYWIATVIKIAGYKALMRYEGFGDDYSQDFWVNLCIQDIHPVGWCATSGKPLVPPKSIQHKYNDWKDYLVKRLTGARTLPSNFYSKVVEGMNDHKIKKKMHVEVVDKMCVSAMRVASVDEIVGGRLRLHYDDEEIDEFWCHMKSSLVHPVGWSQQVGHKLQASQEYKNQCLGKITMQKYDPGDATPDMFPQMKESTEAFKVGMKLEAIDPLNLSAICVATVMKVLKSSYLMIGIDGSMAQNGSDWFCYHASSPCIFPVGFCEVNGLNLTPPKGYKGSFKWYDYLKQNKSVAAPVKLFDKEIPKHGFKPGQKLEAVDLMEPSWKKLKIAEETTKPIGDPLHVPGPEIQPWTIGVQSKHATLHCTGPNKCSLDLRANTQLICVGMVTKVVGRLLRIHFDGWETEYDQWVDCESPDLYPVGWCEVMKYSLEGPRIRAEVPHQVLPQPKKRKGKTQIYKGPRKKRKPKVPSTLPLNTKTPLDLMRQRVLGARLAERGGQQVKQEPFSTPDQTVPQSTHLGTILSNTPTIKIELPDVKEEPMDSSYIVNARSVTAVTQSISATLQSNPVPVTQSALLEIMTSSQTKPGMLTQAQSNMMAKGLAIGPVNSTTILNQGASQTVSQSNTGSETHTLYLTQRHQTISPEQWTVLDVCQFLKYNDCGAYLDTFHKKGIDGKTFLSLTKEMIVNLTGMKVGSSLKVYELIQILKSKMTSQEASQNMSALGS
ncbi:hypothetical protein CHS0354_006642 [Potamilus streckersoni]|uniref:Polycomb protein Sfmbt-like n=1 Tax=Potamilus streckersoni TaxID=2493646 RepID=A0AAE0SXQ4_9BIVA|nr:hypothetical protein CHS0354_006642 [Potamilus streckersoni]